MIIYSVTVTIDTPIAGEWLTWMLEKHIPSVIATGYFQGWHMSRLIDPPPEGHTLTFNLQYECKDWQAYIQYKDNCATKLQEEHQDKFKGRFVAIRTLLERI